MSKNDYSSELKGKKYVQPKTRRIDERLSWIKRCRLHLLLLRVTTRIYHA